MFKNTRPTLGVEEYTWDQRGNGVCLRLYVSVCKAYNTSEQVSPTIRAVVCWHRDMRRTCYENIAMVQDNLPSNAGRVMSIQPRQA